MKSRCLKSCKYNRLILVVRTDIKNLLGQVYYLKSYRSALMAWLSVFLLLTLSVSTVQAQVIGEMQLYHKLTLSFDGPDVSETRATYTDYRLNVSFNSPTGKKYLVPGYFAADGDAANSSASSGNKWHAHFMADEIGDWIYSASLRSGSDIALNTNANAGSAVSLTNDSGSFTISASNKSGRDFRAKGKLEYIGQHFPRFSNGEFFMKVGADSPETFLEFEDFDNTNSSRDYSTHINDAKSSDPTWQNGKGTGITGVINYLADQGINSHYFLTMNVEGDGKKAYPWTSPTNITTYDVSKLDQWQIVFDFMMSKGLMTHFVLSEQENQSLFEHEGCNNNCDFDDSRKLFYREMVARFGYLNAITWNIGEENGWDRGSNGFNNAITSSQRQMFASYMKGLVYYNDQIVVHNGPADNDDIFNDLMGSNYTGIAFQGRATRGSDVRLRLINWVNESANAGAPWIVSYDEPWASNTDGINNKDYRANNIWNALTSGAYGVEFYSNNDITMQNYRNLEDFWRDMNNARNFYDDNSLPFQSMSACDDLSSAGDSYCYGRTNEVYVLYIKNGGTTNLTLSDSGIYDVHWHNPRAQNPNLQIGSVATIEGGGSVAIGQAPSDLDEDWVALVRRKVEPSDLCLPIKTNNENIAVICL